LRALQHFDAVDVEQVDVGADGSREVDAVHVHADAGFEIEGKVVLPNAADVGAQHAARARERRRPVHLHVRREVGDLGDVREAPVFDRLGGHGGYGDRHILKVLLAPLRRNGDFLEQRLCFDGGREDQ